MVGSGRHPCFLCSSFSPAIRTENRCLRHQTATIFAGYHHDLSNDLFDCRSLHSYYRRLLNLCQFPMRSVPDIKMHSQIVLRATLFTNHTGPLYFVDVPVIFGASSMHESKLAPLRQFLFILGQIDSISESFLWPMQLLILSIGVEFQKS
jgi:hypothetical protein